MSEEKDKRQEDIKPSFLGSIINPKISFSEKEPPEYLFHATQKRYFDSIKDNGLIKGQRDYVHLSKDKKFFESMLLRKPRSLILIVRAGKMHKEGHSFHLADNGYWLTEHVPFEYLLYPHPLTLEVYNDILEENLGIVSGGNYPQ